MLWLYYALSTSALFLLSTLVLTLYIDVVLSLSMSSCRLMWYIYLLLFNVFHWCWGNLNQHLVIVNWTLSNKLPWNLNQNTKLFILNENTFENVICEKANILFRGIWIKLAYFAWKLHIDGLVQDCSNSIANALELLQSYTKPSIYEKVLPIVTNLIWQDQIYITLTWAADQSHGFH